MLLLGREDDANQFASMLTTTDGRSIQEIADAMMARNTSNPPRTEDVLLELDSYIRELSQ